MAKSIAGRWDPDWTVAPGEALREWMDERSLTVAQLATRCGNMPVASMRRILAGEEPIDYAVAYMLELGTKIDRGFWLNYERRYREGLARGKSSLARHSAYAVETLDVCRRIVAAQASDEALWSPQTAPEAYVVQELRTLHAAIEGNLLAKAAIEDP